MASTFATYAMQLQGNRKYGGGFGEMPQMQQATQPVTQSAVAQDGTGMPTTGRKKLSALVISGRKTQTLGGRRGAGDGTFVSAMLGGLV